MSWLLVVAAMFMLQQIVRAIRQMLIIKQSFQSIIFDKHAILCIGFFFINTTARLGICETAASQKRRHPLWHWNGFDFYRTDNRFVCGIGHVHSNFRTA